MEDCLRASNCKSNSITIDFFAGSGTTAHAIMNFNSADGGKRKYILIEMGSHFHSVILPRVKKVAFSNTWKDGKSNKGYGQSQFVKIFELEQYEDVFSPTCYDDADLFNNTYDDPYNNYVFLRMLKSLALLR